jgi:hypothetical protein
LIPIDVGEHGDWLTFAIHNNCEGSVFYHGTDPVTASWASLHPKDQGIIVFQVGISIVSSIGRVNMIKDVGTLVVDWNIATVEFGFIIEANFLFVYGLGDDVVEIRVGGGWRKVFCFVGTWVHVLEGSGVDHC